MIVKRANLSFLERLYFPTLWSGLKVALRHF